MEYHFKSLGESFCNRESAVQRGVLGRGTGGRKVVMVEQVGFIHVVFGKTSVDSLL